MPILKEAIKKILINNAPDRMLQFIKRPHYLHTLKTLVESKETDLKVIQYLVCPGDSVVDIGANIGIYSKYLSDLVGAEGRVFSVEPIPLTFDILKSNFKKLHIKNVDFINAAISDIEGVCIMEVPLYNSGGENFYEAHIVAQEISRGLRRVNVQTKTIDSLFSRLAQGISFIKCDAEGYELECIKGAAEIIQRYKPAWLIEISRNPDGISSKAYKTFTFLYKYGYEAFWFNGLKLNKRNYGDKSINYFFLMPKHLCLVKTILAH